VGEGGAVKSTERPVANIAGGQANGRQDTLLRGEGSAGQFLREHTGAAPVDRAYGIGRRWYNRRGEHHPPARANE